jgi:mannan endo-1,4-beta-mannosidase
MNMKKSTIISLAMLTLSLTASAASPARQLIKRMAKIENKGIMIGHQDDPLYGHDWKWQSGRSDVLETVGDWPAVMGFELGHLELGHEKSLDNVPFDLLRQEAEKQHARGGIVEMSWHPDNPVTDKSAWDPSGTPVKAILPGGSKNKLFRTWLDRVATFLGSIKDAQGKRIPIIFRPWHEMGGGWFWWGAKSCTPEEYQQLYRYTHDTLTKKYKLNNLVWAFSPNAGDSDFLKFYPGDKYVDLMGFDLYDFNNDKAAYQKSLRFELDRLVKIAAEHKKLAALTETGAQQLPDSLWFTHTLLPVLKNYRISYVLFWRNAWDNPKELYVPYKGSPAAEDFKRFAEEPNILTLKKI